MCVCVCVYRVNPTAGASRVGVAVLAPTHASLFVEYVFTYYVGYPKWNRISFSAGGGNAMKEHIPPEAMSIRANSLGSS